MTAFLQTSEGDLAIVNTRLQLVSDDVEKAQKINNKLRLFQGEWFLDTRVGTPWYGVVFVKNPDLSVVKRMFRDVILSVDGIVDVQEVSLEWDRQARVLSWEFKAISDEGTVIDGSSQQPFIVELG